MNEEMEILKFPILFPILIEIENTFRGSSSVSCLKNLEIDRNTSTVLEIFTNLYLYTWYASVFASHTAFFSFLFMAYNMFFSSQHPLNRLDPILPLIVHLMMSRCLSSIFSLPVV